MLRPEELTWTTRAEVCAQLAEFLLRTPPVPCAADAQEDGCRGAFPSAAGCAA